ncbi:Protein flaG [Candidatus Photodesmus blepharus]|uniref:Protein flaG n=1 Tax=Candidatus Photodesmus blepharonis TaxID=1179155 RepID=A0A084CP09_9GAMM|nr:flagellar protein FlaG [Candidatus Photodesmus blepharus]KEY91538.1 Protein flaG [Candidatus Photodesmus blepharus]
MEIPSDTSNIQPYASINGIKIAVEDNNDASNITANKEDRKIPETEREKMAEQISEFISSINTDLSFRIDEKAKRNVVTIYETSTGKIIRQIPDEAMLEILRDLRDQVARYTSGLLIDKV